MDDLTTGPLGLDRYGNRNRLPAADPGGSAGWRYGAWIGPRRGRSGAGLGLPQSSSAPKVGKHTNFRATVIADQGQLSSGQQRAQVNSLLTWGVAGFARCGQRLGNSPPTCRRRMVVGMSPVGPLLPHLPEQWPAADGVRRGHSLSVVRTVACPPGLHSLRQPAYAHSVTEVDQPHPHRRLPHPARHRSNGIRAEKPTNPQEFVDDQAQPGGDLLRWVRSKTPAAVTARAKRQSGCS